ncbi:tryptase-like [Lissotriton helveticus]
MGSLLKDIYKDASIFAISASPFTVHFQLRFCNSSASGAVLRSDTVTQALVNSYSSIGQAAILVNSSTVIVKDDGSCLPLPRLLHLEAEWPWQVRVMQNGSQVCIGSLISASLVLSVASCLTPSYPAWYSVQVGARNSTSKMSHLVKRIMVHPEYSTSLDSHDIALIQLEEIVWFGSTVLPICLAPLAQPAPPANTMCWAAASSETSSGTRIFKREEGTISLYETCTGVSQDQSICWTPTTTEEIQIEMGASVTCSNTTYPLYLTAISPDLQRPGVKNPNAVFILIRPFLEWIETYTPA